ncbi:hypothetical protein KRR39_20360 [Nocardioides panacis]|uniref:Uncharacterized protein n=1 Tax=Nocardioides panacis TaxID=2849501 RepID=A0A975XZT0_9ACTN|nr:hypothetical protein [Nocardioides panacis]QWZ07718.1 hypothetical protein KRR39_20360 [Nocardioides panacis]
MASQKTYYEAMQSAVDAATVDADAPHDERVTFDRHTLDRVMRLYKEPGGEMKARFAWRDLLNAIIERRDAEAGLALWTLRDRLTGSTGRRYEETVNGLLAKPDAPRSPDDPDTDLTWLWPEG